MPLSAQVGLIGLRSVTIRNTLHYIAQLLWNKTLRKAVWQFKALLLWHILDSLDTAMVLLSSICYLFSTNKNKPQKALLKKKSNKKKKQEEVGAEEISYSEINVIRSCILL